MSIWAFIQSNARFLAAGFLLTLLSSFGQTFFISIFSGVIRQEFALSHAQWGGMYAAGTFASAFVLIWVGGISDLIRTRILGAVVLVGLGLSALFMSVNHTVSLIVLSIFLLRFFGQGMASHLASVAMARWFNAQRGRALALSNLGFSLGEAVLPLSFVVIMAVLPWRALWVICACVAFVAAPVLYVLLRAERTPQDLAKEDHAAGMQGRHWTRSACLRHPLFWLSIPALLGPPAFNTAFFFQQVPYAEMNGWAHVALVALFPLYTLGAVTATLGAGVIQDRFGLRTVLGYAQLPMVGAFIAYALAPSLIWVAVGMGMMALTSGAMNTWFRSFWAEFYGTAKLGAIKAMSTAVMVVGSALGPGITGWGLDHGIALSTQYLWVAGYFAASSGIFILAIARYRQDLPPISHSA